MQYFTQKDGALVFRRRQELLEIRPWGEGLRVRATQNRAFTDRDWALSIPAPAEGRIEIFEDHAEVSNGRIKAVITDFGKMRFLDQDGKELLKEYYRSWDYGTEGWKDLDQITMGGNGQFALGCLTWLADQDTTALIAAKSLTLEGLSLSSGQATFWAGVFMVAVPLVLLILGITVTLKRRRRR